HPVHCLKEEVDVGEVKVTVNLDRAVVYKRGIAHRDYFRRFLSALVLYRHRNVKRSCQVLAAGLVDHLADGSRTRGDQRGRGYIIFHVLQDGQAPRVCKERIESPGYDGIRVHVHHDRIWILGQVPAFIRFFDLVIIYGKVELAQQVVKLVEGG